MATRRRAQAVGALLLMVLLLQSCARPAEQSGEGQPVKLKVLLMPYLGYAPLFIAQEEGYFREQGLEVEFVRAATSLNTVPLFVKGDIDVYASVVSTGLVNAIARGAEIRIVADKGHVGPPGDTYITLVARRDMVESGKLASPAQLEGLRFSMNASHITQYYVETLLASAGLSGDDISVQNMPIVMRQEALANGAIDLASATEPWGTRMVQSGVAVVWHPACDVIPGFQFAVVAYGPRLLKKDPDAGRRFMVAYLAALRRYNEGKTERNLDILEKGLSLDRELLKQAAWSCMHSHGRIDVQSVLDFQEWAKGRGLLDRVLLEEEFWDPSFVEYANEVLGETAQ